MATRRRGNAGEALAAVAGPKANVFISHTHSDVALAEALRDLLKQVFLSRVASRFSTNKELDGGIRAGEDWYRWIVTQVRECQVAFILLTPASVQKPWILWESGAVYGASEALGENERARVRPLLFQLRPSEVPSPLQRVHVLDGTSPSDVAQLLKELLADDFRDVLGKDEMLQVGEGMAQHVRSYLDAVARALRDAPLTVTEAATQEWLQRLEDLQKQGRLSEVEHLHEWIRISFGREREEQERPIDLRIHRRLGDIYQAARKTKAAIAQYRLAESLAPRDLYLLRKLGQALLDDNDPEGAGKVISRIGQLDPDAVETNQECAALNARWLGVVGQPAEAAATLLKALQRNKGSYYLWELRAQALLQVGDRNGAQTSYRQAADIIASLKEENIWTHATSAAAAIVSGQEQTALTELARVRELKPNANNLESVERGLRKLQQDLDLPQETLAKWMQALSP